MKVEYQQQKQEKSYKLMETQRLTAGLKKKRTRQKIKDFLELNENDYTTYLDLQNIMKAQSTSISLYRKVLEQKEKTSHSKKSR